MVKKHFHIYHLMLTTLRAYYHVQFIDEENEVLRG